jgi:hypothetical protein
VTHNFISQRSILPPICSTTHSLSLSHFSHAMGIHAKYVLLIALAVLVLLPAKAHAFGAGNIA